MWTCFALIYCVCIGYVFDRRADGRPVQSGVWVPPAYLIVTMLWCYVYFLKDQRPGMHASVAANSLSMEEIKAATELHVRTSCSIERRPENTQE